MEYNKISPIASKYMNMLAPYCLRIRVAGSIRRKVKECNDIEIVCVRDPDMKEEMKFVSIVERLKKLKGSPLGKYTQRMTHEGVKLDLFMCETDNWGNILLIRTGNWRFSRYMMGIRAKEVGLYHRGGYLWRGSTKIPCEDELAVFEALKLKYIKPVDRTWK